MKRPELTSNQAKQISWFRAGGIVFTLLIFTALVASSAQLQESGSGSSGLLVTLNEVKSGAQGSFSTCINVWDDGRFHLERRIQPKPQSTISEPRATLQIYDSNLPEAQRLKLARILESDPVRELATLKPLETSTAKTWVGNFEAKIVRDDEIQHVGYFEFGYYDAEHHVDKEEISDPQQKAALEPLLEWLQHVTTATLNLSSGKSTLCGNSSMD